ncbi:MAG: FAD-dependent thymidylate synthase, partial [Fibrobacterota bacterium]
MDSFDFSNQWASEKALGQRGKIFPFLDKGFVSLVDVMGNDSSIAEAARTSYGIGDSAYGSGKNRRVRTPEENRRLIRRLMRDRHTSVFEMAEMKFMIKMPIFVMRQHIRHRTASVNEYSGRYAKMLDEFYVPAKEVITKQDPVNKQGGTAERLDDPLAETGEFIREQEFIFSEYMKKLEKNMRRELARINLPVSGYTLCYWKTDLHNLLHYLGLRMEEHAQYEIRVMAEAIGKITSECFPVTYEAFLDYRLNSVNFSSAGMEYIRKVFRNHNE